MSGLPSEGFDGKRLNQRLGAAGSDRSQARCEGRREQQIWCLREIIDNSSNSNNNHNNSSLKADRLMGEANMVPEKDNSQ